VRGNDRGVFQGGISEFPLGAVKGTMKNRFFALEDGTDKFSRNVGKELPLYVA
jgi:hypothetical protein